MVLFPIRLIVKTLLKYRMKRNPEILVINILLPAIIGLMASCGCGGKSDKLEVPDETLVENSAVPGTDAEIPMKEVAVASKTYNVADIADESHIYKREVNRDNCLIVISKREFRLYVYECGKDTLLAASFPVCYAKNPGPKTKEGDMCTPECNDLNNPFSISEINSASTWEHDFGDGRGSLKAYGDWFVRLKLTGALASNRSIGIHGSTNNAASVPGRDSEGCIRLRDADIIAFHDLYAQVGQKVLIKGVGERKLPFEQNAENALGASYVASEVGYKLSSGDQSDSPSPVDNGLNEDEVDDEGEGFVEGDTDAREGEVG